MSRTPRTESSPPAKRRTRLAASARRAQLVDIGREVFARRGYEAASVEEIADRAGITKPVVYEHFGGKQGLYAVVVDREVEYIVARIVEAISSGSARERLENAARACMRYVEERPDGFAMLLRDAPAMKGSGEMPGLMYDLAERVGAVFNQQFRNAGYDAKTAPIYAHALVGMVTFVGQWWMDSRKPLPAATVVSHLSALAWMGLRHLPKRPAAVTGGGGQGVKPRPPATGRPKRRRR
jgi:AcrR family transcriptional regulator